MDKREEKKEEGVIDWEKVRKVGANMYLLLEMKNMAQVYIEVIGTLRTILEKGGKLKNLNEEEVILALNKMAGFFGRFSELVQDSKDEKEATDKFFKDVDPGEFELFLAKYKEIFGEDIRDYNPEWEDIEKERGLERIVRKTDSQMSRQPLPAETIVSKEIIEGLFTPIPAPLGESAQKIQKLQAAGKLVDGTTKGLVGGMPYFRAFTLALAIILDKQSKFILNTSKGNSKEYTNTGILPILGEYKDLLQIAETSIPNSKGKLENRQYPYIIVQYRELADIMGGERKTTGGKDIKQVREYIRKLSEKKYIVGYTDEDKKQRYIGIPLFVVKREYYDNRGNEDICLLELSYQFSKTIRGYSGIRPDTLNRMGGAGKLKDITISLFTLLVYSRGTGDGYTFTKDKDSLLEQIGGGKQYIGRPGKLKKDFEEAIQKVTDAKLITKYQEKKGKLGKVNSIFVYNPRYFDDEELQ